MYKWHKPGSECIVYGLVIYSALYSYYISETSEKIKSFDSQFLKFSIKR